MENNLIEDSYWKDCVEDDVEVDGDAIESLFFEKVVAKKVPVAAVAEEKKEEKKGGFLSSRNKVPEVKLIDPKRAYGIDIGLARFRLSHEQIKNAIMHMDSNVLNAEKLQQLINFMPTTEELELIHDYMKGEDANPATLSNADKFFYTLSTIQGAPDLSTRLQLWLFKLSFQELISSIEKNLILVNTAQLSIRDSKHLKTVFKIILGVGNYMNANTNKGAAYGFKLTTLQQLKSTKSADSKLTLMQYIVQFIMNKHPQAKEFLTELAPVTPAAAIEASFVQTEVAKIQANINKLVKALELFERLREESLPPSNTGSARASIDVTNGEGVDGEHATAIRRASTLSSPDGVDGTMVVTDTLTVPPPTTRDRKRSSITSEDKFYQEMSSFVTIAKEKFSALENNFNETTEKCDQLACLFGEQKGAMKWEQLFQRFTEFMEAFDQAEKQVLRLKQAEEKNELRAQMEAQVKERRLAIQKGVAPRNSVSGPAGQGPPGAGPPKVAARFNFNAPQANSIQSNHHAASILAQAASNAVNSFRNNSVMNSLVNAIRRGEKSSPRDRSDDMSPGRPNGITSPPNKGMAGDLSLSISSPQMKSRDGIASPHQPKTPKSAAAAAAAAVLSPRSSAQAASVSSHSSSSSPGGVLSPRSAVTLPPPALPLNPPTMTSDLEAVADDMLSRATMRARKSSQSKSQAHAAIKRRIQSKQTMLSTMLALAASIPIPDSPSEAAQLPPLNIASPKQAPLHVSVTTPASALLEAHRRTASGVAEGDEPEETPRQAPVNLMSPSLSQLGDALKGLKKRQQTPKEKEIPPTEE